MGPRQDWRKTRRWIRPLADANRRPSATCRITLIPSDALSGPHSGSDRGQPVNDRPGKPRFAIGRSSAPGQAGRTCRLTAYRLINENHKTFGWRS